MDNNTDLSSMIQKIMQNPEFAGMVSELRGDSGKKNTEDVTGEVMSHLPEVLAMLQPMLGSMNASAAQTTDAAEPNDSKEEQKTGERAKTNALQEILPKKYDKEKAEKLLYAIKPYLSSSRSEIIDKCVSVMQITDVVGALQGLEELGKAGKGNDGSGKGGK